MKSIWRHFCGWTNQKFIIYPPGMWMVQYAVLPSSVFLPGMLFLLYDFKRIVSLVDVNSTAGSGIQDWSSTFTALKCLASHLSINSNLHKKTSKHKKQAWAHCNTEGQPAQRPLRMMAPNSINIVKLPFHWRKKQTADVPLHPVHGYADI